MGSGAGTGLVLFSVFIHDLEKVMNSEVSNFVGDS